MVYLPKNLLSRVDQYVVSQKEKNRAYSRSQMTADALEMLLKIRWGLKNLIETRKLEKAA